MTEPLVAPFPWFGGKRRIAPIIWRAFGDVPNYVEPFAGSLAVLLGRPAKHKARTETVNDLDGFISNFWRAVAADPDTVAAHADWPVSENDQHARHWWLTQQRPTLTAKLEGDPDYYDAAIAGWWVWGVCSWIGTGWCSSKGPWAVRDGLLVDTRETPGGDAGQGINRQLPHLGDAGQGINRQLPHLGDAGQGIADWFQLLATRLRRVRVCSGDWTRVVTESVTTRHGVTGVLLDPPYGDEVEQSRVYVTDSGTVAADVRAWCVEHGDDRLLRIALCGYEGEGHEVLLDHGWRAYAWRAAGGYGGGRGGTGDANRHRERVYLSPACLTDEDDLLSLLDGGAA